VASERDIILIIKYFILDVREIARYTLSVMSMFLYTKGRQEMKKIILVMAMVAMLAMLAGCSTASEKVESSRGSMLLEKKHTAHAVNTVSMRYQNIIEVYGDISASDAKKHYNRIYGEAGK